ncbi:MAG TPA: MDR family MFS transporter [Candidatus Binatia bacterium]|jgi:EmrB/QacA subfamily drug resistance transporter|nr:MDR family MFS transporter [Candidatus Binatia bacterium]
MASNCQRERHLEDFVSLLDSLTELVQLMIQDDSTLHSMDQSNLNAPRATSLPAAAKRQFAVTGVMLAIFLFAIDATIVSTAMPTIVAKLGGLELYSWVFSIYMLTSALTTPLFGKLSDLYSQRRLMLISIGIFVLGSMLCGGAQSMEALILFRAIQGLGGGAIYALSFIVVGILYRPEERAKIQGIISGIWGVASILGPLAGGIIVEHWSWRWAFFVNLPITAVAVALIIVGLKESGQERRAHNLDFAGTFTLLAALMLLFYALSRSSHAAQPLSAAQVGLIALGILFLMVFYIIERRAAEAIVPLDLFKSSLFTTSAAVGTLAAMGVFGAISYLPLYLQGVTGLTASRAGMVLLFLSVAWTAGSLIAGQALNRLGYRASAAAGMILLAVGYSLFVAFKSDLSVVWVAVSGTLIGTGMGMANLTTLVAVQNSVSHQRIGVATSTLMLFRTFGGAFAVSLMGTVLLHQMQRGLDQLSRGSLSAALFDKLTHPQNLLEPATRAQIPPPLLPRLIAILGDAIWYAFLTGFALMLLGVAASYFMSKDTPAKAAEPLQGTE